MKNREREGWAVGRYSREELHIDESETGKTNRARNKMQTVAMLRKNRERYELMKKRDHDYVT